AGRARMRSTRLRGRSPAESAPPASQHDVTKRRRSRGIRHDSKRWPSQSIEFILDEYPEPLVYRDRRQTGVSRLLQAFDQERTVRAGLEHVRVEIMAFDFFGVGQDDPTDAERRDLRPQPAHH